MKTRVNILPLRRVGANLPELSANSNFEGNTDVLRTNYCAKGVIGAYSAVLASNYTQENESLTNPNSESESPN